MWQLDTKLHVLVARLWWHTILHALVVASKWDTTAKLCICQQERGDGTIEKHDSDEKVQQLEDLR